MTRKKTKPPGVTGSEFISAVESLTLGAE